MRLLTLVVYAAGALASAQQINPFTGDELVATVAENCLDMDCVKQSVLTYLDNVLKIKSDTARNAKVKIRIQTSFLNKKFLTN